MVAASSPTVEVSSDIAADNSPGVDNPLPSSEFNVLDEATEKVVMDAGNAAPKQGYTEPTGSSNTEGVVSTIATTDAQIVGSVRSSDRRDEQAVKGVAGFYDRKHGTSNDDQESADSHGIAEEATSGSSPAAAETNEHGGESESVSNDADFESLVDEDDCTDDETKSAPNAVTAAIGGDKEPAKVPVRTSTEEMHEMSDSEVDVGIGNGRDPRVQDGHAESAVAEQDGDVGNVVRPLCDKVTAGTIAAVGEILIDELEMQAMLANQVEEGKQNLPGEHVEGMKGFDLHGTGNKAAGADDDLAVEMASYANSSWNRTAPTPGETICPSSLGLGDEGPGEVDDLPVSERSSTLLKTQFERSPSLDRGQRYSWDERSGHRLKPQSPKLHRRPERPDDIGEEDGDGSSSNVILRWFREQEFGRVIDCNFKVRHKIASGYLVGACLAHYYPNKLDKVDFNPGESPSSKKANWEYLQKFLRKRGFALQREDVGCLCTVPMPVAEGIAATNRVLQSLYAFLLADGLVDPLPKISPARLRAPPAKSRIPIYDRSPSRLRTEGDSGLCAYGGYADDSPWPESQGSPRRCRATFNPYIPRRGVSEGSPGRRREVVIDAETFHRERRRNGKSHGRSTDNQDPLARRERYPADRLVYDVVGHNGGRRSSRGNSPPNSRRLTPGQPQPTNVRIRCDDPTAGPKIGVSSRDDALRESHQWLRGKHERAAVGDHGCGKRTTHEDNIEGRETQGRGLGGRGPGGRGGYYSSIAKSEERYCHGVGSDKDDDINNDATMRRSLSPGPRGATAVVDGRRRLGPVEAANAMYPVTRIERRRPLEEPGGENGIRADRVGNAATQSAAATRSNIAGEHRRDGASVPLRYSSDPHNRHVDGAEQTALRPGYCPRDHSGAYQLDGVRGAHGSDNHREEGEGHGSGGRGEKRAGRGAPLPPGRRIQASGAAVETSAPISRTPERSKNVWSLDSNGDREQVIGRGHDNKANNFTSPPQRLRSRRRVRAEGNGAEIGSAEAQYAAGGRGRAGVGSSGVHYEYAGGRRGENRDETCNGHSDREWGSRRVDGRGERIATRRDRNGAAGTYNDDRGGWDDSEGGERERGGDGGASQRLRQGGGGGAGRRGGGHEEYAHRRQQSSPEQSPRGGVTILTRSDRQQAEYNRQKPHQRVENQEQRQDRPPYDRRRPSDRDAWGNTQKDYNYNIERKNRTDVIANVNLRANRQQGYEDDDEQVDGRYRGRHFQEERWEHHYQQDPRQSPQCRRSSDHDTVLRVVVTGGRPSNGPGGEERDNDRTTALSEEGVLCNYDQETEGVFQLPRGQRRRSSGQEGGRKGVEATSLSINPGWRRDPCVDDRSSQQGLRRRRRRSGDGDTVGYADQDREGAGEGGTYWRPSPPRGLLQASSHTVSPPRLQRLGKQNPPQTQRRGTDPASRAHSRSMSTETRIPADVDGQTAGLLTIAQREGTIVDDDYGRNHEEGLHHDRPSGQDAGGFGARRQGAKGRGAEKRVGFEPYADGGSFHEVGVHWA